MHSLSTIHFIHFHAIVNLSQGGRNGPSGRSARDDEVDDVERRRRSDGAEKNGERCREKPLIPPKPDTHGFPGRNQELAGEHGSTPAPRAAGKVSEVASGTRPGSAFRHAVLPITARPGSGGPAARALERSSHSGQRRRTRGRPASQLPSGCRSRPQLLRVPGVQPGAPLQAFENSGLAGRVRRGVRMFLRGVA